MVEYDINELYNNTVKSFVNDIEKYYYLFDIPNFPKYIIIYFKKLSSENNTFFKDKIEILIRNYLEKNVINKNVAILAIFFNIKEYKNNLELFIKNNFLDFSLNDISLIYKKQINFFNKNLLLELYLNTSVLHFDSEHLLIFSILTYVENLGIKEDLLFQLLKKCYGKNEKLYKIVSSYLINKYFTGNNRYENIQIKNSQKNFKIALAISGYLDYSLNNAKSLKETLIKDLNVDIYLNLWKENHLNYLLRTKSQFSKFLKELRNYCIDEQCLKKKFPNLYWLLDEKISLTNLAHKVYNTSEKNVLLENDDSFKKFSLHEKIIYKIFNSHNFIMNMKKYDFIIHVNSNIDISYNIESVDWDNVLNRALYNTNVFLDFGAVINEQFGLITGTDFVLYSVENSDFILNLWDNDLQSINKELLNNITKQNAIASSLFMSGKTISSVKNLSIKNNQNLLIPLEQIKTSLLKDKEMNNDSKINFEELLFLLEKDVNN